MSIVAWLVSSFWPYLLAAAGLAGAWFWHTGKVEAARSDGAAQAINRVNAANLGLQQEMAGVERPTPDEVVRRLGDGTA